MPVMKSSINNTKQMMLMASCLDTKVAASHLDTVLDKLKDILDNVGDNLFKR